jgi:hypothetical protein
MRRRKLFSGVCPIGCNLILLWQSRNSPLLILRSNSLKGPNLYHVLGLDLWKAAQLRTQVPSEVWRLTFLRRAPDSPRPNLRRFYYHRTSRAG